MMDGILVKSDLLTCVYILASIYADITECHHQYNNQEFTDLKGLFNNLKIHLKNTFVLAPSAAGASKFVLSIQCLTL